MRKYVIGIDVGGTSVKFGKFTLYGDLIDKWRIKTNKTENGRYILNDIVKSIQSKITLSEIKGIGIGVPGPVTNNVVIHCVNLGWGKINLEIELKKLLNDNEIIIEVGNDANVAAAGEMYKGVAQGFNNVVMFTLGTGVGAGIILDGKLLEGVNGSAGELGHVIVDNKHNYVCGCGKKGCLETVASATGIVRLAKERLKQSNLQSPLRRYDGFSAKKVFDYAKSGDIIAQATIEESMEYLATVMANTSLTVDPEIIVIGGGVSLAGEYIIEQLEKQYYSMVNPFIKKINIKIATLGNDAGIYGCAYLIK